MMDLEKANRILAITLKFFILYAIMFTGNNFFYAEQTPLRILLTSIIEVCVILGVDYVWQKFIDKKEIESETKPMKWQSQAIPFFYFYSLWFTINSFINPEHSPLTLFLGAFIGGLLVVGINTLWERIKKRRQQNKK